MINDKQKKQVDCDYAFDPPVDNRSTEKTTVQLIKFCIIGASNTIIGLLVYYAFVLYDGNLFLWGNVAGFLVSVLNSYYWNNKYVFKGKKNHLLALGKTYLMYGSTMILSTIFLYILVDVMNVSEFIAPLITLFVTVPLNFILSKYWAYRIKNG